MSLLARNPAVLYDLISDVTRMGEWSPVCTACEWVEGSSPSVGAVFVGHNETPERSWDMRCRVFVADPGREFAFATIGTPGGDDTDENGMTRWGYTFTAVGGGTDVEESWELTRSGTQDRQCDAANTTTRDRRNGNAQYLAGYGRDPGEFQAGGRRVAPIAGMWTMA